MNVCVWPLSHARAVDKRTNIIDDNWEEITKRKNKYVYKKSNPIFDIALVLTVQLSSISLPIYIHSISSFLALSLHPSLPARTALRDKETAMLVMLERERER
eukprot:GHVU01057624.1.p1 GENE.GHVU01057624.1~~GHVU01057624.1.p1  ORF type:complete len:102 (-),score=6.63 GHVU01057624.1:81-386(-)